VDEFTDEDIQLTVESEDDSRFCFTVVSVDGRKLSMAEVIMTLELYINEVNAAGEERAAIGGLGH
jgi:hypothetical protein